MTDHALLRTHGPRLLSLAQGSIAHTLNDGSPLKVDLTLLPSALGTFGASFVTLKKDGHLRGCIGSPEAWRPLATDVVGNAARAAFHDPRFDPLRREETAALTIHISVLSSPSPFMFSNQADLLSQLIPGTDGLIIKDQACGALFLPSVWDQLPDPVQFLAHLLSKAGLPPNHWSETFQAWRFIVADTHANWSD